MQHYCLLRRMPHYCLLRCMQCKKASHRFSFPKKLKIGFKAWMGSNEKRFFLNGTGKSREMQNVDTENILFNLFICYISKHTHFERRKADWFDLYCKLFKTKVPAGALQLLFTQFYISLLSFLLPFLFFHILFNCHNMKRIFIKILEIPTVLRIPITSLSIMCQ